jgi:hypothetical protein
MYMEADANTIPHPTLPLKGRAEERFDGEV